MNMQSSLSTPVQAPSGGQKKKTWHGPFLTILSTLMLLGLVTLVPWLLTFSPVEISALSDTTLDPSFSLKQSLLLTALTLFWISFGFSVITGCFERRLTPWFLLQIMFTTTFMALALRAYPYWVNGYYTLVSALQDSSMPGLYYRPSVLQPFVWPVIGEIWGLVVLVSHIPLSGGIFFSLIFAFKAILQAFRSGDKAQKRLWTWTMVALLLLLTIILLSFALTPDLEMWILS